MTIVPANSQMSLIDTEAFEIIEKVAELHVQGTKPMTIAKSLGMKVVEVKHAIEQWNEMLRRDAESTDMARDHLNRMVSHYDDLIVRSYGVLKDLDSMAFDEKVAAQKNATLKNISDYEARRVDALQKAGLLDAHDLGDELAEREEREAALINILRNHLCDNCKREVAYRLGQLTGQVEVVRVDG